MNQFPNSVYRNWNIRSWGGAFACQIHSARAGHLNRFLVLRGGDLNKAIFKNSNARGPRTNLLKWTVVNFPAGAQTQ